MADFSTESSRARNHDVSHMCEVSSLVELCGRIVWLNLAGVIPLKVARFVTRSDPEIEEN